MSPSRSKAPSAEDAPLAEVTELPRPPARVRPSPVHRRTRATLQVSAGPDLLRYVLLTPHEQILIGRDPACQLPLADPTVSKRHARVVVGPTGSITVFDLQSTNGTSINRRTIRRAELRPGDHLEVGQVSIRMELLSEDELNHLAQVYQRLSAPDREPVTGLLPRSFIDSGLIELADRCFRSGLPVSLLQVDVDRLEVLRQAHGTSVAGRVVSELARLLMLAVRDDDPVVRSGGGAVTVFLPSSTESSATVVADRLRRVVAGHDWARTADNLLVTVSVGVAERDPHEPLAAWLRRGDDAVLAAKQAGRNRVERASSLRGRS